MLSAFKDKSIGFCRRLGRVGPIRAIYDSMPILQSINNRLRNREKEKQRAQILRQVDIASVSITEVAKTPFETGMDFYRTLHTHSNSQEEIRCLEDALACFEKEPQKTPDLYFAMAKCLSFLGRISEYNKALENYYTIKYQEPDFIRFEREGNLLLPVSCIKALGCLGYLTTYVKIGKLTHNPKTFLVPALPNEMCNESFLSYFEPYIKRVTDPSEIAALNQKRSTCELPIDWGLEFQGYTGIIHAIIMKVEKAWNEAGFGPLLTLRKEHFERGRTKLKEHGIDPDRWFVCLHVRASGFHNDSKEKEDFRNADINTYRKAVREIVAQGGLVFRMGDSTMQPFEEPGVIDYAHSAFKSDWMDVYLLAQCRFLLGTSSGVHKIPFSFGVPCVQTNATPMTYIPFGSDDIVLPKLFRRGKHLLSFAKMLSDPYSGAAVQYLYDALKIETVNNTDEEILQAVKNMLMSFEGQTRRVPPLTPLQKQFNALAEAKGVLISGQIDTDFLQRHQALFKE